MEILILLSGIGYLGLGAWQGDWLAIAIGALLTLMIAVIQFSKWQQEKRIEQQKTALIARFIEEHENNLNRTPDE